MLDGCSTQGRADEVRRSEIKLYKIWCQVAAVYVCACRTAKGSFQQAPERGRDAWCRLAGRSSRFQGGWDRDEVEWAVFGLAESTKRRVNAKLAWTLRWSNTHRTPPSHLAASAARAYNTQQGCSSRCFALLHAARPRSRWCDDRLELVVQFVPAEPQRALESVSIRTPLEPGCMHCVRTAWGRRGQLRSDCVRICRCSLAFALPAHPTDASGQRLGRTRRC